MYGFGGLQAINSPAGQTLFLSTPEERSAAWARVYVISLGAILCVIGFVVVIVGAVKEEE